MERRHCISGMFLGAMIAMVNMPSRGLAMSRDVMVNHRWLLVPVRNGAALRKMTVSVDGKTVLWTDVALAEGKADWWGYLDVGRWKGKRLTIGADQMQAGSTGSPQADSTSSPRAGSKGLGEIYCGDEIPGMGDLYREALRPQIHFSAKRGWLNDPNGLVFYRGEYHLFFQHSPFSWESSTKFWGDAVSKDLVHWREVDEALYPDELGPMWSGSAVVDWKNSSGFGKSGEAPLVLMYTAAGESFTQCIAYSTDGRHFAKYAGNPVIKNISPGNRDPRVFWDEARRRWVVAVYVEDHGHTIHFFTSTNLRDWKPSGVFAGGKGNFLFECPDIFPLDLDGKRDQQKWIMTSADSEYEVGRFDGETFVPETAVLPGEQGVGFYAAQTFNDEPDGRRIQIGWMQTTTPGMPFNQSMSLPMELKLVSTKDGPRMTRTPIEELASLREKADSFGAMTLKKGAPFPLADVRGELMEIRTEFEPGADGVVDFKVRGVPVVYDAGKQEIVVNGHRASAPLVEGKQRLIVYVDRTSVEVLASDGLTYVPMPINLDAKNESLGASVERGKVKFDRMVVYRLRSAWDRK